MVWRKIIIPFFLFALFISAPLARASETNGTIDSNYKYSWGENLGWINFKPDNGGLTITDTMITGYAWSTVGGWINFSVTNGGVTNTSEGVLGGNAWSSQKGWIAMSGITINSSGKFVGTAGTLGTTAGRITFSCDNCDVRTDWRPASARTTGGGGSVIIPTSNPTQSTPAESTTSSSATPTESTPAESAKTPSQPSEISKTPPPIKLKPISSAPVPESGAPQISFEKTDEPILQIQTEGRYFNIPKTPISIQYIGENQQPREIKSILHILPVGQKFSLFVKTKQGARSVTSKFIFQGALADKEKIQKTVNKYETFFEKAVRGLKNIFARKAKAAELPLNDTSMNADTGAYSEEVTAPTEPGVYELQTSIDYEGKITEKKDTVIVYPKGIIAAKNFWGKQKSLNNADVAIFRKNTETGNFEIWNAGEFGLENPVKTAENGEYYFSIPAGEYQIRVSAQGYKPYIGEFTVADGEQKIINDIVFLKRSPWSKIVWWITGLLIIFVIAKKIRFAGRKIAKKN